MTAKRDSSQRKARKNKEISAGVPEEMAQCNIEMRKTLKKQLAFLALENDMTIQAFLLSALKDKGLDVSEADLIDKRRQRG